VAVNQVEFHPYLYQQELLDFCRKQGVALCAHRPLAMGAVVEDPVLQKIGEKHGKSACQVSLRWIVQRKIPVIPRASDKKRLKENLSLFDFTLSDEEMAQIDALNRNKRFCDRDWGDFDYLSYKTRRRHAAEKNHCIKCKFCFTGCYERFCYP
jgi:diketogulonate reductase-like aldo/keto reductase